MMDKQKFNEKVIGTVRVNLDLIRKRVKRHIEKRTKIIWNYDKNCNKSCSFCAYGNQAEVSIIGKEFQIDDKLAIIDSISSVNLDSLDIATGDNPNLEELKKSIEYARRNLGSTEISITTTSEVIRN